MADHKYIPNGIGIKCDKGSVKTSLTVINPTDTILGKQWATSGDKIVGQSFQSFGSCSCRNGMPCTPSVLDWQKTAGPNILCIGNELLID